MPLRLNLFSFFLGAALAPLAVFAAFLWKASNADALVIAGAAVGVCFLTAAFLLSRGVGRSFQLEKMWDAALLSSIGDGVVATDKDKKIVFMNPAAAELLGIEKDSIVGAYADIIAMEDSEGNAVEKEKLPFWQVGRTKEKLAHAAFKPYYFLRSDGARFPAAFTVVPVIIQGRVAGMIMAFRNITQELEVDKAKSEFVSLASHQLRTPLSTIGWYTELLLSGDVGKPTKEQARFLHEIYEANHRMVDLVNALLDVSRLELGTFAVEPESTNLVDIMKKAVVDASRSAAAKSIKIEEAYERIPTMLIDPRLTRIVVDNFLTNAIRYTPEKGKIFVSVRLDAKKDAAKSVLISVRDTGYGIPEAQRGKIFTKLFRADNIRARDTQGTGLGLYIVKSILDVVGGRVWFESKEDQGTTFFVELPLAGMKPKIGVKRLE